MDERVIYKGNALQGVDAKGRVAIPHTLRAAIEQNSQVKFVNVSMHLAHNCLIGFDRAYPTYWNRKTDADEARELEAGRPFDREGMERDLFGMSDEFAFDDSGRFVLPSAYRKLAGIEGWAFFVGVNQRFEIWNPRIALETAALSAIVKASLRIHLEEKGIVL